MPYGLLETYRQHLARADAILPLSLVGIVSGLGTGVVILAFRRLIESSQTHILGLANPEAYETLSIITRLSLPIAGGLVIGLLFALGGLRSRQVGVVHVMEQLAYRSGRLPLRSTLMQFFAGALSIASGHSVGREGPVIHLGAASSSLLGQWLRLPNNSIRTLVACGTAASIGASFNTPIAGVIFAMEVVMLEYTVTGFVPVMLAAVTATAFTRVFYGDAPAFDVPALHLHSQWELAFIVLLGVILGALAAAFIYGIRRLDEGLKHIPLWARTTFAGLVTGVCALVAPQIMGIGYDTVELALLGHIALTSLLLIAGMKLFATTVCVSMGIPGGLIGPTLVIGATAGGALGIVGHGIAPELSAGAGLYAMLGMGAMMGATLQAPLAALMGLLELTANPGIILPAMLAIVTATLTTRVVFRQDSVFVTMLRDRGIDYRFDPVSVALSHTGVGAVMSRQWVTTGPVIGLEDAAVLLGKAHDWILVTDGHVVVSAIEATRLAVIVEKRRAEGQAQPLNLNDDVPQPAKLVTVKPRATLREALDRLEAADAQVVLVTQGTKLLSSEIHGIVNRDEIEASVRYRGP